MVRAGQKLQEERLRQGLTLEDVERATKIKASFLSAIEKGEYHKLPASSYAQGFVRNYTLFLGLSERDILPIFRREFNEKEFFRVLPEGLTNREEIRLRRLRVGQTATLLFLIFLAIASYVLFQYRYAIINPPLAVYLPKEGQTVETEIVVSGKADVNATVTVNEEVATVDEEGNFEKRITLFPGKATITASAKNRLGRETVIKRHVSVQENTSI